MNHRKKLLHISIHVVLWLLLFYFNYSIFSNSRFDFNYSFFVFRLGLNVIVFYCVYFLLVPLIFRKRIILFVIFSVVLLTVASLTLNEINKYEFNVLRNTEQIRPPGDWGPPPNVKKDGPPDVLKDKPPFKEDRLFVPRRILFNAYGFFFFFFLGISLRFIQKWQRDERNKAQLEKEKVKTELDFLKQQINPHFLFNSLNSIYSMSISKSEQLTPAILKLSSILRYMLYETGIEKVELKDELKVVEDYIELQKLRLTSRVEVKYEKLGEEKGCFIEPFILLPIIENAFKYGVDNLNDSYIHIKTEIRNNRFVFNVTNKIVVHSNQNQHSGIGLNNIQRRLELIYKDKHFFKIKKNEDTFSVNVELDLKS